MTPKSLFFALTFLSTASLAAETITDPDYMAGVAALKEKQAPQAIAAFERCIAKTTGKVRLECHWEKGWAHWIQSDWKSTVATWEVVYKATPEREEVGQYLKQARDNLKMRALLAEERASAPSTFETVAPEGTTLRLRAVGDMMIGTDFPAGKLPPEGQNSFGDVGPLLADADLTFGNLEGPLCDNGRTKKCRPDTPPGRCFAFRTPSRYLSAYVDAGFDMLSTANNHAGDFGELCRQETESHLDSVQITHSGRPGDVAELDLDGLRVAMIAFHSSRSCHYINDHDTAAALVRKLAGENDIVIVSYHGGAEGSKAQHVPHGRETFYGEDRGHLRKFTHLVIDAGADLVLGHGPHVLRAMEIYKGRLIAYSLGNFATYGRFGLSGPLGLGVILETTLDREGRFVTGKLIPTRQQGRGVPFKDPEGEALDVVRRLSAQDFPASGILVSQDGQIKAR